MKTITKNLLLLSLCLGTWACGDETPVGEGTSAGGAMMAGGTGGGGATMGAGGAGGDAGSGAAGGAAGAAGEAGSGATGGTGGQAGIGGTAGAGAGGEAGTGGQTACISTQELFVDSLWTPIFESRCLACHTSEGIAANSRLVLVSEDDPNWLQANLATLQTVVDATQEGTPLLLLKPTGRVPHTGGSLIDPDGELYARLENFAGRLSGRLDECGEGEPPPPPASNCEELEPGRRLLRRLSHTEYTNTIRDLLGLSIDAHGSFVADSKNHGFENDPELLNVSGLLAMQYTQMAETLSEQFDPALLVSCDINEGDMACAHEFIAQFGLRAYRRPLTASEIEGYRTLFALVMGQECFEQGVRWVVAGMLQSPHFLYRTELGRRSGEDRFTLTPYELASELAYLVWQTMPDAELFELAASGNLLDGPIFQAQVARLLADPRSTTMMFNFLGKWMGFEDLMMVVRDSVIYEALYFEVRESMMLETQKFASELWERNGPYGELFTAEHTYLDERLSAYYGIPLAGAVVDDTGFARTELGGQRAGGILTHGSMMTTHAQPTSSSPIHRGIFVREQLLCEALPPPPEGLDIVPPEFNPDLSTRETFAAHSENEECFGCHRLIDDIGFGFEHYDGIGRYREEQNGSPIDASGLVVRIEGDDVPFHGVGEMGAFAATDEQVRQCYARQWFRFGVGETEGLETACQLSDLVTALEDNDARIQTIVEAITRLPHFRQRTAEEDETDTIGADLTVLVPGGMAPEADDPATPPPGLETPACGVPPVIGGDGPRAGVPGLEVSLREDRWNAGYCAYYAIANTTAESIEWAVDVDVEGTINNAWNVSRSGDSGQVRFSGVEWNAFVQPNQQVEFGFCAAL